MAGVPGTTRGHARTIGGASCRLEADGTVHCDFGARDPHERQRTQNPGAGCYVNTGTNRWECSAMPELNGQPAQINSVHTDPTTGQSWASVGERKIQVPAFPVSVGRRRRGLSMMKTTRSKKCPDGMEYDAKKKRCVVVLTGGGDPLPNPMTVRRHGVQFSPPPSSRMFARISNPSDFRRVARVTRSSKKTCEAACASQHKKNSPGYYHCIQSKCGTIGLPPSKGRVQRMRRRNQTAGSRVATDMLSAAPAAGTGPGNTWTFQDAMSANCCVFVDSQGAYLTCDPLAAGGGHPLHGLEVQLQAENQGIATVCHPTFVDGCWRLPLCSEAKEPSTCCVRLGQFPKGGLTFTGIIECSDPTDPLHGTHVMTGDPYQKNGQTFVSFDVGGDVSSELPVCETPSRIPPEEPEGPECCVVENGDGTVTLVCDPDPYGWNGMNITGANCMDTQSGRMCALEFTDSEGNQVTLEAPVCPKIPPTYVPPEFVPPECCVDATTSPPTLQDCSDPSYNGTPVQIFDEQDGKVMVSVPWSSTLVPMPLCDEPPGRCPPCPECPPPRECPPPEQCPSCPPNHWMAPDGSCVTCPPGHLIDPASGQCVKCPPPGECPTCPPGTYLDTNTGQCVTCPECPPGRECPPGGDCPPCPECPPDGRIPPPWPCCPPDEDCDVSPGPRMPHFPDPGPVPGCDPDDPCCYECSLTGGGTVANPCNPCRAGRR